MGYTKKETDFWGNEKEVHYDDNNKKVGETRYRETFLVIKSKTTTTQMARKFEKTQKEEGLFSDGQLIRQRRQENWIYKR